MLFFWTFIHQKILNKTAQLFFNTDIKKKFEQQISILEWFLKDHMTLTTGAMAAENSALPSQK